MAREIGIDIVVNATQAEQAIDRVEQRLDGLAQAATPAGRAVENLDDKIKNSELSFKRQDEAVAGSSRSLVAMALRVVGGPAGIAAAFALGARKAVDFTDNLDDLSKKTKIGTDAIQTLGFIASKNGASFDQVATAASEMGRRLSAGMPPAVKAMESLGLSVGSLLAMKPEDRFRTIGIAIAGVKDPAKQTELAFNATGRGGRELLGVFSDLRNGAEESAPKMSSAYVQAGADVADAIDLMIAKGKTWLAQMALFPIVAARELGKVPGEIKNATGLLGLLSGVTGPGGLMAARQQMMGGGFSAGDTEPAMATDWSKVFVGPEVPDGFFAMENHRAMAEAERKRQAQARAKLAFVRPELRGETDWTQNQLYNAQWYNASRAIPGSGVGPMGFPGWQPLSGQMEGGLPWASYASMTATQNRPNIGQRFMQGTGGRFLGAGMGMATQFLPGMNQMGAGVGAGLGSALGGLKGVTGLMGSFAPMLGPLMGIAGGLIGKLFGPSEKEKTQKERSGFIGNFGGMDALKTAADRAGFSLDGLMNAKKMTDFNAEVKKLETAMGAFEAKVQSAQQELDGLQGTLNDTLAKGAAMGYNFNAAGELVSVSFEKMQEKAKLYGLDLDALGPTFQRQRLHEAASEIINDFDLLTRGGAEIGTVLSGMSGEISKLVTESIKFGVDIPANMEPWIKELLRTNQLTDENGVAMTDLGKLKFAAPIETEFSKISTKLTELVDKIAEMITKLDDMTRPRTIDVGWNVQPPPEDLGRGSENMSLGGFVGNPRYLAGGGFIPRGTDTVPAMLTPGEGVLRRESVSRLMRGDWPQGGGGLSIAIENVSVDSGARSEADFEVKIGRAVIQGMKRKGVRLNAA